MAANYNLKKRKLIKNSISNNPTRPTSDSDSDSDPIPIKLHKLLSPYSKDQLITLAIDTALTHTSFYNLIHSTASKDITHRKIFVYGLARETTRQTLLSVFEEYGEIEECNVVMDHVSGKAKGYAFIVFKTRKSALKALKQPQKTINNRLASCKLASMKESSGVVVCGTSYSNNEFGNRKIYVSNVPKDVDSEKLRMFFGKFGEIEVGPMGFDPVTGKSKGYALFVYKTVEEAKKCLEEPNKMFEGRQLYCKKAAEGKFGGGAASITTEIIQQPALLAMTPGQGVYGPVAAAPMGMLGQNPTVAMMNPFYGGIIANPYGGYVNPFVGVGGFGQQMGGYGGLLDSLGRVYGGVGSSSTGGVASGLLQAYPNKQVGQPSTAKLPGNSGYSSHL